MRFNKHGSLACALLSLSLAGCAETATAPSLAPSANAATPSATTATATPAAAPVQPLAGAPAQPACPADTTPVNDASPEPGHMCHGALPAHFAQVMSRLSQLDASPAGKKAWPTEDVTFTVIPGLGRRMDIMVGRGGSWIRSFEGTDPATTVYLVNGLPCEADSDDCKYGIGLKAYQVTGNAAPVDVTAQLLPDAPVLSAAQRAHYDESGGGPVWLDIGKLPLVPTMRWVMEFDPDQPNSASDPHDAGGVAHFGFLVWTGHRFELKDRVPRSQWPCYPVPEGARACAGDLPENGRFVISGK